MPVSSLSTERYSWVAIMNARKLTVEKPNLKAGQAGVLLLNMDWKRLGEDIRARRIERNMTQRQIAEWHGLTHSTISRLELRGSPCSVETLLTLTIMLDIDLFAYVFATSVVSGDSNIPTLAAIMGSAQKLC